MEFQMKTTGRRIRNLAGEPNRIHAVVENILLRVPLKPLTRFKLVSKSWCTIITNLRRSGLPLITNSSPWMALFTDKTTFVKQVDHGKQCTEVIELPDYLNGQEELSPEKLASMAPVDSLDGWLLLSRQRFKSLESPTKLYVKTSMYVLDPVLRRVIPLPKMPMHHDRKTVLRFSIFRIPENQVKVMCLRIPICGTGRGTISCFRCKSKDGRWEQWERQEKNLECSLDTYQPRAEDYKSIYGIHFNGARHKGNLYWVIGVTCLLVYDFNKETFRIQQLPARTFRIGMLCESEGLLHYWEPKATLPGFYLWRYDDASDEDRPWLLRQGINFHELPSFVRPLFFNYDLQTLYLDGNLREGEVYSYSFEKKTSVKQSGLTFNGNKEAWYLNMVNWHFWHGFPFQLY